MPYRHYSDELSRITEADTTTGDHLTSVPTWATTLAVTVTAKALDDAFTAISTKLQRKVTWVTTLVDHLDCDEVICAMRLGTGVERTKRDTFAARVPLRFYTRPYLTSANYRRERVYLGEFKSREIAVAAINVFLCRLHREVPQHYCVFTKEHYQTHGFTEVADMALRRAINHQLSGDGDGH